MLYMVSREGAKEWDGLGKQTFYLSIVFNKINV